MAKQTKLGGTFTLPGTSISLYRMGYGAMQLAGPQKRMFWYNFKRRCSMRRCAWLFTQTRTVAAVSLSISQALCSRTTTTRRLPRSAISSTNSSQDY
jgi:hypothetical protein